jgi:toxin ParE1/3/4
MEVYEIEWSDRAKDGLMMIKRFAEIHTSKEKVKDLIRAIHKKAQQLQNFPFSKPIDPFFEHLNLGHRFVMSGNARIIFRVIDKKVLIVNVIDGRMDPERYFVVRE